MGGDFILFFYINRDFLGGSILCIVKRKRGRNGAKRNGEVFGALVIVKGHVIQTRRAWFLEWSEAEWKEL